MKARQCSLAGLDKATARLTGQETGQNGLEANGREKRDRKGNDYAADPAGSDQLELRIENGWVYTMGRGKEQKHSRTKVTQETQGTMVLYHPRRKEEGRFRSCSS